MALLKPELKKEMLNQINKGISINKISKSLNLGKSTIYYYYKKIKGKKFKEPEFKSSFSETEGEIVGIFSGDGSQYFESKSYHYTVNVHFGFQNIGYATYVKNLYETFFNKKFRLEILNKPRGIRVRTYSKDIFNYFKNYMDYDPKVKHCTIKLKSMNLPIKFKIGLLRGLFDTDGSILDREWSNGIRISFCTTSSKLIKQVKSILSEFNIQYRGRIEVRRNKGYKDLYSIIVVKKDNDRFLKLVRPFKAALLPKRAGSSVW